MIQNLSGHKVKIVSLAFLFFMSLSGILWAEVPSEKRETFATQKNEEAWTGIDVSIVSKYAEKYGHPPRDPYINTDKGDLLLFVFTVAGVVGGFIIGFNARKLFYEK